MPRVKIRSSSTKNGRKLPFWHVDNFLSKQDFFGKEVPSFNIKGNQVVNTVPGGLLSTMIMGVTLGFAATGIFEVI